MIVAEFGGGLKCDEAWLGFRMVAGGEGADVRSKVCFFVTHVPYSLRCPELLVSPKQEPDRSSNEGCAH
jgi:hypothetical protein